MPQTKGNIVIVDDDHQMREMLRDFLTGQGYEVHDFARARPAFEEISQGKVLFSNNQDVDVVVTDLNMPEMDGIELIQNLKRIRPEMPILLITAYASIESAIEATRKGAFAYIVKPFKLNEFEINIEKAMGHGQLARENVILRKEVKKTWSRGHIIGKSQAMEKIFSLIDRVSKASANVLIAGASGTGKELIARSMHEQGPRKDKQFVAVNCTAIPDTLLESELFGHVKGSFTGAIADKKGLFEEANGGTLFLDEIGDLNLSLQAKLLRVLQEREVKPIGSNKSKKIDVRIITATHKDLKSAVKNGEFREDLFYRLSVIPVNLPPLRERREDIPLLANHFLQKYSLLNHSPARRFTAAAMEKMLNNSWEGNVRELENLVERTVVLTDQESIDAHDIMLQNEEGPEKNYQESVSDWPTIDEMERRYIRSVLEKVGGRKEKAARILGINRRTLYRKEQENFPGVK